MRDLMNKKVGLIVFILLSVTFSSAYGAEFQIDKEHSSVSFKIRHLLSRTQGNFNEFRGLIHYEEGTPESWSVEASVDIASIDTNVKERDDHLRSADFFDVENYPTMTFKSDRIENATAESAKLHGTLTIRGVSKPVVFDLEIFGVAEDPWGMVRSAFSATTTINRTDFGLTWNEQLETGKLLVGEEVKITLDIEGILKK